MANDSGLGVRLSAPGRLAELVARHLVSRDALLDLINASTRPVLTSTRWREGNGDIPLFAAAQLRRGNHVCADAPGLEFFELETGDGVAEVDVFALVLEFDKPLCGSSDFLTLISYVLRAM